MHARTLRSILLGAVASSVAACNGSTTNDEVDPGVPLARPFDCFDEPTSYEALRTAMSVDYLELRIGSPSGGGDGGAAPTSRVDVAVGSKCRAAADKTACEAALAALTTTEFLFGGGCGNCAPGGSYLAYTKGDAVGKVTTVAELLKLTGTVDAPAEAWMLGIAEGDYVKCDGPWIGERADGLVLRGRRTLSDCPAQTQEVVLLVRRDGTIETLDKKDNPPGTSCAGRRPAGLVAARLPRASSIVGEHLAHIARLEAASVDAFRILRRELAAHGAPERLLRAAERAARDEIRHARMMARLARLHGGRVERPRVERGPVRPLVDVALENAVEGCVRETYGALEGLFQSRSARDSGIRRTMREIARDETRHGALSWRVASWLDMKLSASERRRVRDARAAEVEALAARVRVRPHRDLVAIAGVPDAPQAEALAASLRRSLWKA